MVASKWCFFLGACNAEDLDLTKETPTLILTEGAVLGGGAFSRVSEVSEETTGNTYAMKRMRKSAVVQCPEHVYFEQVGQDALPALQLSNARCSSTASTGQANIRLVPTV